MQCPTFGIEVSGISRIFCLFELPSWWETVLLDEKFLIDLSFLFCLIIEDNQQIINVHEYRVIKIVVKNLNYTICKIKQKIIKTQLK